MLTIKNPLVPQIFAHYEVFSSSTFLTSWVGRGDNGNTFIMKKAGENGLTWLRPGIFLWVVYIGNIYPQLVGLFILFTAEIHPTINFVK